MRKEEGEARELLCDGSGEKDENAPTHHPQTLTACACRNRHDGSLPEGLCSGRLLPPVPHGGRGRTSSADSDFPGTSYAKGWRWEEREMRRRTRRKQSGAFPFSFRFSIDCHHSHLNAGLGNSTLTGSGRVSGQGLLDGGPIPPRRPLPRLLSPIRYVVFLFLVVFLVEIMSRFSVTLLLLQLFPSASSF